MFNETPPGVKGYLDGATSSELPCWSGGWHRLSSRIPPQSHTRGIREVLGWHSGGKQGCPDSKQNPIYRLYHFLTPVPQDSNLSTAFQSEPLYHLYTFLLILRQDDGATSSEPPLRSYLVGATSSELPQDTSTPVNQVSGFCLVMR